MHKDTFKRNFIILKRYTSNQNFFHGQKNEKSFYMNKAVGQNENFAGYLKIETRGQTISLSTHIQELKENTKYQLYLIDNQRNCVLLSDVYADNKHRSTVSKIFPKNNCLNTNKPFSSYRYVVLVCCDKQKINLLLYGYLKKDDYIDVYNDAVVPIQNLKTDSDKTPIEISSIKNASSKIPKNKKETNNTNIVKLQQEKKLSAKTVIEPQQTVPSIMPIMRAVKKDYMSSVKNYYDILFRNNVKIKPFNENDYIWVRIDRFGKGNLPNYHELMNSYPSVLLRETNHCIVGISKQQPGFLAYGFWGNKNEYRLNDALFMPLNKANGYLDTIHGYWLYFVDSSTGKTIKTKEWPTIK